MFTFVPGVMTESEFKRFAIEVALADETGTASLALSIPAGTWVKTSLGAFVNYSTEPSEILEENIEVNVTNGTVEIEVGCYKSLPIEVSGYVTLLSFTKDTGVAIFNEPFESALEITFDDFSGTMVTPNYSWGLSILNTSNGTSFTVDNGFEFTLSMSSEYGPRGFYMYPLESITELTSPYTTNLILNLNTTLMDESLGEEDAYYGVWVVGLEADLWLDLRPDSFFELSPSHGMLPEISCAHGQENYQYQLLGSGEHSIDLSIFDSYLGGSIQDIVIEAFIHPLIN